MNRVDNISGYRDVDSIYCSPKFLHKTAATTYDFPEHPPKKDKKWSLGSLFRRKKKDDTDTSSDEECDKKGFLRRRKKDKRKKSSKHRTTFDHIVPVGRTSSTTCNGYDDTGILSDPTGGFATYVGRDYHHLTKSNGSNAKNKTDSQPAHTSLGSADSLLKKNHRKSRAKVRAEARRDQGKRESSSEDDSASSSRFRSDENLGKSRDGSVSRRSRAARTERYIRRLSRDDEAILNRESNLRPCKSDADHSYRNLLEESKRSSPISTHHVVSSTRVYQGLSTIPPSHHKSDTNNKPPTVGINKYNSLTNDYKEKELGYQRSISYDADIHKTTLPVTPAATIMHVQFPVSKPNNRFRNLSLVEQPRIYKTDKHPPPPPPRDPWRLVSVPNGDNVRPLSYCFERTAVNPKVNGIKPPHSFNWHPNYRSTSEDQLASQFSPTPLQPRPSSAASDNVVQRFIRRHPSSDDYRYLTDKSPRSRKPIVIKSPDDSSSQVDQECQKALDFWKEKDQNELNRHQHQNQQQQQNPVSPQMFTAQTRVSTKIFLPSVLKTDMDKLEPAPPPSPFQPISPAEEVKSCKSSNLEEALDELEAIYNSLRLGDEDLLERAEQREQSMAAKKLQDSKDESYPGWGVPRGAISDSSFNYEPFDSVDSPKRKRLLRRSRPVDRKCDDMAYRKLNKERNDPKEVISKVSYLLASPVHGNSPDQETCKNHSNSSSKEPDVTFDDVVYRNVKHANSILKVSDPQPPFGIPVGPILPGANSDYLHAVPETIPFKTTKKIPDIVKDDLAFRNLRKDSHKDPVLPPLMPDDFTNNNNNNTETVKTDFNSLKKKRAVRSLSANLYNLIQNQSFKTSGEKTPETKSSLTDIADAMEIARRILKEKEEKISDTRRAFLSDSEAKYRKHDELNERRLNFLNGMKSKETFQQKLQVNVPKSLQSKPPRCSIIPKSPPANSIELCKALRKSSLEDLLTAFAVEAHETCEQISNESKEPPPANDSELLATTKTESTPIEEEVGVVITPVPTESLANVVITRNEVPLNVDPIVAEIHSEPEHDYVNLGSDTEIQTIDDDCKTDPVEVERKDGGGDVEDGQASEGELCDFVQCAALTAPITKQECAFLTKTCVYVSESGTIASYLTDCDIQCNEIVGRDSSNGSQKSSGFHSNSSFGSDEELNAEHFGMVDLKSLESPNLVLRLDREAAHQNRHTLDITQPTHGWHNDPIVLAFACSYGFACVYQLVSLDAIAVLGILFVIVSFVAALIL